MRLLDVLDEFANVKIDTTSPVPATSGPGRPGDAADEDEFAKQLQSEMAELLAAPEMQQQFDELLKGLGEPGRSVPPFGIPPHPDTDDVLTTGEADHSFQETIRKTMARMKESGDLASAAAVSTDSDDILAQMLKEMESGGFGGEGNDEGFSQILMGMMEQLTNKEILYEPMKELNEKFPAWLIAHRGTVDESDLKRYEEQCQLVGEIVQRFEKAGYSDSNAADREYIVQRMQKVGDRVPPLLHIPPSLTTARCNRQAHLRPILSVI